MALSLGDLVGDANGEVVLYNDSNQRTLAVSSPVQPAAWGKAGSHVMADGTDVSGFRYVRFPNGLTLFYPPDLQLVVVPERR